MGKSARGPTLDWGVGQYERTAQMLLPAAQVLVDAAALRVVSGHEIPQLAG